MADVPPYDPRRSFQEKLPRLGALVVGLLFGLGVLGYSAVSGRGIGAPTLALLYLSLAMFLWGLNGFVFRRFALGGLSLLLFTAAVFGVLFLLGFFMGGVVAPFAAEAATAVLGRLHLGDVVFLLFAGMTVAGAAGTAFSHNIIYSAWSLLFAFMGVAGLYIFLGADFVAVAQVLIYVGGILVLILFAIMLTKQIGGDPKLTNAHLALPLGATLGLGGAGVLAYTAIAAPWNVVADPQVKSTALAIGRLFLTDFLLPFEIASLVLLAALVGAVVIARKEIKESGETLLSGVRPEGPDATRPEGT